jgi:transposase-like protein
MSTNPKKTYDAEFKKQAVQLLISSGRPLAQVARELGVPVWNLPFKTAEMRPRIRWRSRNSTSTCSLLRIKRLPQLHPRDFLPERSPQATACSPLSMQVAD